LPAAILGRARLHAGPGWRISSIAAGAGRSAASSRAIATCYARRVPQYVIERDIPGAGRLTQDEIRDISMRSLQVLQGLGPDIQWVHTYVTDDRMYCVYLAPEEGPIREHARQLGVPASRISAVRHLINPAKYK
jgi:hypothetical protein